jgi:hypothetical protein
VATTRKGNAVYVFNGGGWHEAAAWSGNEVTAACACGDAVVCAALDDQAYLVRGAEVTPLKLPEQSDWIYGAAALSDDVALLGGAGLFVLSVTDQTVQRRRLSEFNISRPGRDVLRIVRTAGRTIVLGKKNLLVEYHGDSAVELVDRKAIGAELFFFGAAQLGPDLWLTGSSNLRPFLARPAGNTVQFDDVPLTAKSPPVLAALADELLIGGERLLAGKPGQWRELVAETTAAETFIGMTPITSSSPHRVCAFTSGGTSYFTDGHAVTEIDVF